MIKLKAWFVAQGGYYHVAALAIVFLTAGFNGVPAFKALCLSAWVLIPTTAKTIIAAIAGLYVLYTTSHHVNQMRAMKVAVKNAQLERDDARAAAVLAKTPVTKPTKKG